LINSAVERFVIDIVKIVVKDTGVLAVYKFNGLLLLKETSKSNSRRFIEYLDKKLLARLHKIAASTPPRDCLKEYCRNPQPKEAERFYQLLLECFGNWGGMFKDVAKNYQKFAQDLTSKRRLPIKQEFWNFPMDLYENSQFDNSVDRVQAQNQNRQVDSPSLGNNRQATDNQHSQYNNYQGQASQNGNAQPNVQINDTIISDIGRLIRVYDKGTTAIS
jgi:hypothetical protein